MKIKKEGKRMKDWMMEIIKKDKLHECYIREKREQMKVKKEKLYKMKQKQKLKSN